MDRLTQRLKTGEVLMAMGLEDKYTKDEWICVLQERLADYEDTELTPEEICKIRADIDAGYIKSIARTYGIDIARMKEIAKADRDDRVVVLPCKVGDTVWRLQYVDKGEGSLPRFPIEAVETQFNLWMLPEFGETVFLAREEAEKMLRRAENGKENP